MCVRGEVAVSTLDDMLRQLLLLLRHGVQMCCLGSTQSFAVFVFGEYMQISSAVPLSYQSKKCHINYFVGRNSCSPFTPRLKRIGFGTNKAFYPPAHAQRPKYTSAKKQAHA
jgi:hypothetical protein